MRCRVCGEPVKVQGGARHSHWGLWISSAGRYWANRRGNARIAERPHSSWAMTIDADSIAELEKRIEKQEALISLWPSAPHGSLFSEATALE